MTTKVGIYRDKRNKRRPWVVRWCGEHDPITGKQRRYAEPFATKREAVAFRAAKQAAMDKGDRRDRPRDITVSELVERFKGTKIAGNKFERSLRELKKYMCKLYDPTALYTAYYRFEVPTGKSDGGK